VVPRKGGILGFFVNSSFLFTASAVEGKSEEKVPGKFKLTSDRAGGVPLDEDTGPNGTIIGDRLALTMAISKAREDVRYAFRSICATVPTEEPNSSATASVINTAMISRAAGWNSNIFPKDAGSRERTISRSRLRRNSVKEGFAATF
jgi:hypothetical protein